MNENENGNNNVNEKNDSTGENEALEHVSTIEKYIALREEILQKSKTIGQPIEDFLVMTKCTDPYSLATELGIKKAKWAYNLYNEFIEKTGMKELHVRGLHYFIVMKKKEPVYPPYTHQNLKWEVYENSMTCSNYLAEAMENARYFGLIPYENIIDEKNDVATITIYGNHREDYGHGIPCYNMPIVFPSKWSIELPEIYIPNKTLNEYLKTQAKYAAKTIMIQEPYAFHDSDIFFPRGLIKPFHIEIWCEKALPKHIKSISGVDVFVEGSGQLSITLARDFINKLNKNKQDGVILYISDFDPAGNDMPVAIARKLQTWMEIGDLKQNAYLHPILLTKEQVIKYNLPQVPLSDRKIKSMGSAATRFLDKAGEGITELQALYVIPNIYEQIVRDAVKPWRASYDEIERVGREKENKLIDEISGKILDYWDTKRDVLQRLFDDMFSFAEKVKHVFPDNEKIKMQYEKGIDMINKYRIPDKLRDELSKATDNISLPSFTSPKIEREPPIDCLYDSRRNSDEQTRILKSYKNIKNGGNENE